MAEPLPDAHGTTARTLLANAAMVVMLMKNCMFDDDDNDERVWRMVA